MYLFFDTETTGVPIDYHATMTDLDNWPRVIQIAWQVVDKNGEVLSKKEYLIKPDGWEVPTGKFWKDNGFDTATNEAKGVPMEDVLDEFLSDYNQCDYLVAHNIRFDYNVLGCELIRYKKKARVRLDKICTMLQTQDFVNIGKWPKLQELHVKLFGEEFDDAHDANADVTATVKCFFELKKKGVL